MVDCIENEEQASSLATFQRFNSQIMPASQRDLDRFIEQLLTKRQLLTEEEVKEVCDRLKEVLARESNVHHIQSPVTVVGDVHGQFYDVLEIFRIGGNCPDTNYLFLGDYVDRGFFSVETMTLLAVMKLRWPARITLLRGNHESRAVTRVYGFYNECLRKYNSARVWNYFVDMFDYLTISVVIDDCIFGIHGGLSPAVQSLDQIRVLDRFKEIPHEGPIADIMWSDPDADKSDFCMSPRGAGYTFGADIVTHFNHVNGMKQILRAHQLCMEGFQVLFDGQLSTVWSAPNYCYRCGNLASVLEINASLTGHFNIFSAAPENEREDSKGDAAIVKPERVQHEYFL